MADKSSKSGRNSAKCKKYKDSLRRERNKVRRLKKTIAHNTNAEGVCNDECAKNALKEALKKHSGK